MARSGVRIGSHAAVLSAVVLFFAASLTALLSHIAIDVLGDYLLANDAYDHVAHHSRELAFAAVLGCAFSALAFAVRAALREASGSEGALCAVLRATLPASPWRDFALVALLSLIIVVVMEALDASLAGRPTNDLADLLGGSPAMGLGVVTAVAVLVTSAVWCFVRRLARRRAASGLPARALAATGAPGRRPRSPAFSSRRPLRDFRCAACGCAAGLPLLYERQALRGPRPKPLGRNNMLADRRLAPSFAMLLWLCLLLCPPLARAELPSDSVPHVATVSGRVLDAQTGIPLAGATVTIPLLRRSVQTDRDGRFAFSAVPIGSYVLRVERSGYAAALSDDVLLTAGTAAVVTLALQAAGSGSALRTIAHTSLRASESLQRSSIIYRELSPQELAESGTYRAGDALRQLPAVNNGIAGDTAALGDDLQLNIRGIGTLETTATLDGHRIAYGVPGGYNYQLSPIVGMRAIDVVYGSGSNSFGTSAIGGIVNFSTLEPTPEDRMVFSQGWGTFDKDATTLLATGTRGRLGFAAAGGVSGLDGPLKNQYLYQPGAAYDQSATDPAVTNLAVYQDDSSAVSRTGMLKLRYNLSGASALTFTTLASSYWENKTGNGDGDFANVTPLLAFGNQLLAAYNANPPIANPCPPGSFIATNANGVPNGTGPNGKPDGGMLCQTPQQYAQFNAGWQGLGTAWQSFNFNDYGLTFQSNRSSGALRFDAYTNRYFNTIDRHYALPFLQTPGDSPLGFTYNLNVAEAGATLTDLFSGKRSDLTAGLSYLNTAYNIKFASTAGVGIGTPIVQEEQAFVHEVYRAVPDRLTAYFDVAEILASATHSWATDPRAALVYTPTSRDVVRLAAGATTTQPSGDELDQPFVPQLPGGAGGGAPITCNGLNSIGTAPSSVLKPERGVDEDIAYGHRFFGDTQAQIVFYNLDVYGKLYQTLAPLSETGTSFIDPQYLTQATASVAAKCGASIAPSLLGVNGTLNVGQLRAQGFMFNGRLRVLPKTYFDFDWTLDSTTLQSAPGDFFASNLTDVQGSQLPRLPLHTLSFAVDQTVKNVDLRYTLHAVSVNNTKSLPAYNYSELRVAAPLGPGRLSAGVTNLFNQYAFIQGYRYEGVPLPLNGNATAASYAPYTGANATELFGLPYRAIFFNYLWEVR